MPHPPVAARPGPRRLPKLAPVAGAAVAGVMAAEWTPAVEPAVWCLGLAMAVAWFGVDARRPALLFAVAAALALSHALARQSTARFPLAGPLAEGGRIEVTAVGVVADAPVGRDGSLRFPLRLEFLKTPEQTWRLRCPVMVRWRPPADAAAAGPPACGDRVTLTGWMSAPAVPRNPGQFDVAAWLGRQGMAAEVRVERLEMVETGVALPVKRTALGLRDLLASAITIGLSDRLTEASVIKAMVLGTRDGIPEDVEEAFLHSGTLHIFSVSGLHVGLVAVILWRGLNLLRLTRRQAAWASIPLVFCYALVTGWQPAAVRSAWMAAVVLLGICLDRAPSFFNSLCLAALIILAGDTQSLMLAGAQLSFVVIGVIAAAGPPLARRLTSWVHPDPLVPPLLWSRGWRWALPAWGWLAQMLAVSGVAAMGSAPLTLWHFQLATPASLAANLLHVPLAGLILATAGLSAAFRPWWPAAATVFTHANLVLAHTCVVTARWFAAMPGGSILWNPRSLTEPAAACRITVFDLGEGGATLIRTPQGKAWLIDTGRPGAFHGVVLPGLTFHAVRRLDGLVLSHGDHDHVGAASEALAGLTPSILLHPPHQSRSPALRTALAAGRKVARPLTAGTVVRLDETTTLSVLWPPAEASVPLADDGCLVLRLECAGRSIVFSNDAGFLAERAIGLADPGMQADVWVRGRHATDLSGTDDFVAQLRSSVIVCAGRNDPVAARVTPAWRSMAEAGGAMLLDQSEVGAVAIIIRADGALECRGFLGGTGGLEQ